LRQRPNIVEKPNAVEYEYKGGGIEFRNVSYRHMLREVKDGQLIMSEK